MELDIFKVYVVTTWNDGEEPIIALFANLEAATKFYGLAKELYSCEHAIVEEAPVYKNCIASEIDLCMDQSRMEMLRRD